MFNDKYVIGICTSDLQRANHAREINRLSAELIRRGCYVLIFSSDSDLYLKRDGDKGCAAIYELPDYNRIDAMVVYSASIMDDKYLTNLIDKAKVSDTPVISMEKEVEGCINFRYDREDAFEKIVRHVVEYHNCREVNFIAGMKDNEDSERRLQIYKDVLDDNDIPFEEERIGYGDFWSGPTREVMEKFMDPMKVPPEAIICANDSMAITATDWLAEHDIKVPEDIIVTGLDGITEGEQHLPGITTGARNLTNDIKTTADVVLAACEKKKIDRLYTRPYRLQLSQSCGCQMNHLFDPSSVLSEINERNSRYIADIFDLSDMQEDFLNCEDNEEFSKLLERAIPDDSFVCINLDLSLKEKSSFHYRYGETPFSDTLRAYSKIDGKVQYGQCFLEMMVPESGKEMPQDRPIVLFPLHFRDRVVGYMGVWLSWMENEDISRIIQFIRSFNNSAGYRLSE